ncbi:hypothetical protein [Streptomyces sp. WAC01280]|uniref:hypothetical protein n=1 Tax=Streptomyces sp. WAC01280 TaxID=2487424 RepID=UPI000F786220|nr:hypothetical protein [Streptomyces sp. WAC01280]RSS59558.1 hypothetical protein EF909_06685 [Streptomyces sp. WAC01280]
MTTQSPEQPIEPGQVYRPTPDNAHRRPEDRITVTRVWTADDADEPSYAFDIATVDYRDRPITMHSALRESVFRKCYVLDTPPTAPDTLATAAYDLTPADTIERAVALLDSLDAVAYVAIRPDADGNLDTTARTRGIPSAYATEAMRTVADEIDAREQARTNPFAGLLDYLADRVTADVIREHARHHRTKDRP